MKRHFLGVFFKWVQPSKTEGCTPQIPLLLWCSPFSSSSQRISALTVEALFVAPGWLICLTYTIKRGKIVRQKSCGGGLSFVRENEIQQRKLRQNIFKTFPAYLCNLIILLTCYLRELVHCLGMFIWFFLICVINLSVSSCCNASLEEAKHC